MTAAPLHGHWVGDHSDCPPDASCRTPQITEADVTDPDIITVSYAIPVSREVLDDALPPFDVIMQQMEETARAFAALPPEEQERIKAEKKAAYEAQRCAECGCHPDEHGG